MLSQKTIVVTGAASGIGAETAKLIQQQGGTVIGIDINVPQNYVDRFIFADLGNQDSVKEAVASIPDGIDGLCNIAGLPPTKAPGLVLKVNFLGLRELTLGLIPKMADSASIVNLASLAGMGWATGKEQVTRLLAIEGYEAIDDFCQQFDMSDGRSYFLSKEALIVWTMQNRWTWRERGIRMNCVSPGPVDTPILKDFNETLGERAKEDERIMDRPGTPQDIAPVCAFLLSAGSGWIRGANIATDGGMFAHVQCHLAGYE